MTTQRNVLPPVVGTLPQRPGGSNITQRPFSSYCYVFHPFQRFFLPLRKTAVDCRSVRRWTSTVHAKDYRISIQKPFCKVKAICVFLVNLRGWSHVKKVAEKDNAEQSDKSKIANWRSLSLTHFPAYDRAENSTQYRTLASLPEKDNGMVEGNILHLKNHRKNKWFWTNQRLGF